MSSVDIVQFLTHSISHILAIVRVRTECFTRLAYFRTLLADYNVIKWNSFIQLIAYEIFAAT